jgi:exodeoxyribonuclease V alpha subunit
MELDQLDEGQATAVTACLDPARRVVAVTGPAGTGKTSLIKFAIARLEAAGFSCMLLAPTGKAAKRIQEATGYPAMTIHRGLEYSHPGERDPKTGKPFGISAPKRTGENPLTVDYIFVDEYAMVNHELHRNLFDALGAGCCVRVFGDNNQLQPIEKNAYLKSQPPPFATLLKDFNGIVLKQIHRQTEGSGIIENGSRILAGFSPVRRDDFGMLITDQPVERLKELLVKGDERGVSFKDLNNQIISPRNTSWVGTHALNQTVQLHYQMQHMDGWLALPRHEWDKKNYVQIRQGDKVLIKENDYQIRAVGDEPDKPSGVFNGEVGIVESIDDMEAVYINLGDRTVIIPPIVAYFSLKTGKEVTYDPRKNLDLAYVLTTHKTQGSEYQNVVMILNKSVGGLLCRRNFYTGVTRARKTVTLIADQRGLSLALARMESPF